MNQLLLFFTNRLKTVRKSPLIYFNVCLKTCSICKAFHTLVNGGVMCTDPVAGYTTVMRFYLVKNKTQLH